MARKRYDIAPSAEFINACQQAVETSQEILIEFPSRREALSARTRIYAMRHHANYYELPCRTLLDRVEIGWRELERGGPCAVVIRTTRKTADIDERLRAQGFASVLPTDMKASPGAGPGPGPGAATVVGVADANANANASVNINSSRLAMPAHVARGELPTFIRESLGLAKPAEPAESAKPAEPAPTPAKADKKEPE